MMEHNHRRCEVASTQNGLRLDKFLADALPQMSRSRLQQLLEEGCVKRGAQAITSASAKVKPGECYEVFIPTPKPSHIAPQAMALDIVYEDEHMLVLNKPPGLTVHPAPGNPDSTLVNALLAHCGDSLSGIGGVARPGIVHRIDKETSGLLVVAKHDAAHHALADQLSDHTLGRTYAALVWGVPQPKSGTVSTQIGRSPKNRQKMAVLKTGGKHAVTHYKTLEVFSDNKGKPIASLVECNLETGRTHQIRVHLSHLGHALIGDPVYGSNSKTRINALNIAEAARAALHAFHRQALHAKVLQLVHPHSGKTMRFSADLPADMQQLLIGLRGVK